MQKRELEASGNDSQVAKHRKYEEKPSADEIGPQQPLDDNVDQDEWERFQALVHEDHNDQQEEQKTQEKVKEPDLKTFDTTDDFPSDDERLVNNLVLQKQLDRRVENIKERVAQMRKQKKKNGNESKEIDRNSQNTNSESEQSEVDEEENWFQVETH